MSEGVRLSESDFKATRIAVEANGKYIQKQYEELDEILKRANATLNGGVFDTFKDIAKNVEAMKESQQKTVEATNTMFDKKLQHMKVTITSEEVANEMKSLGKQIESSAAEALSSATPLRG